MRPEYLADLIDRFYDAASAPLVARMVAVERCLQAIEDRPAPKDGTSVTLADVEPMLRQMVDALPPAEPGKSVTLEDVRPIIDEFLRSLPVPKDGTSVTLADVEPMLRGMVAALPVPKDGTSVTIDEVLEVLEPRVEAAIAKAVLDVERRAQGVLERAVERMPKPKDGVDGKDGFSLDDLQIEDDGEGTVTLRFVRGDLVRERTFRVPGFFDRGVFREGEAYRKGDGVSFGGSIWLAQKDAPEGKPGTSPDWRLAVKKGRDGRDSEK